MKKILIMFLVAIIFIYPIHNAMYPQHADAAIASKAASQAAKQIAKEVIQDIAVETAANFALHQAMDIAGKYEAKQGFKVVCPDGGSTCDKPIQVKETITDTDKQAIKGQAGSELDKLLNGGTGVSKWQKFLDWFMSVWLISFAATALTYAFDSDVRSLFNEAGYNALVSLGFIVPMTEITPITETGIEEKEEGAKFTNGEGAEEPYKQKVWTYTGSDTSMNSTLSGTSILMENMIFHVGIHQEPSTVITQLAVYVSGTTNYLFGYEQISEKNRIYLGNQYSIGTVTEANFSVNGQTVYSAKPLFASGKYYLDVSATVAPEVDSILKKKMNSIQYRAPYEIDGKYYTDVLYNTVDGNRLEHQVVSTVAHKGPVTSMGQSIRITQGSGTTRSILTVHENINPVKRIIPPLYSESEEIAKNMSSSNYEDDSGNVALIPPTALTFKEESTGETVYRVPATVPTDPPVFQKEDGTIVPEENITVGPDPVITPSPGGQTTPGGEPIPEGTPTVTPAPSPGNPSPQPIPLTPTPTPSPQPDPNTPPPTSPPIETTPPAFPEGETCDEGLKIPKFLPLLTKISETFPFSIPFDLYGGFEAIFAEMGKERPEFDFKFNALGEEVSWKITIPDFIDDWKPFTDSFLIFIFDVGIVYAIFRFTGGGK